jgi:serine/threonine protein kinase/Flp pilus assembly protein TadD
MNPKQWQRVGKLFDAASTLEPEAADRYLRQECGSDHELKEEVLSLLRQVQARGNILASEAPWAGMLSGMVEPPPLAVDSTFGSYVIRRLIGAGGMGEVYLAEDTRLQRPVALKLLSGEVEGDAQSVWRFTQEALAVSALNHPNIPVVYEAGTVDGRHYIASEFVGGKGLEQRIAEGVVPWREAATIALEIARALEAAHRIGVVHRDVKPSNILVCPDGRAKLVDFGIAKLLSGASHNGEAGHLTITGLAIGTPGYMAPEQAAGRPFDQRIDIWSLAAVLHELVTGKRPPLKDGKIPSTGNLPRALARVLERGLQTNPERRYASVADFAAALDDARRGGLYSISPRGWMIVGASLIVGITTVVIWRYLASTPTFERTELRRSIAVLPFDNIGGDAGNVYFSQGIQDEVLTHLAQISGLKVISRRATAAFSSRPDGFEAISSALHVGTVLEGSVQKQDDRVRVNVQLIDTRSGAHLWADSYDRQTKDVFDVERDIAEHVAERLEATLLPRERTAVGKTDTPNPDAHMAYLLGHFYFLRPNDTSRQKAIQYYQEAISLDPTYALAYADMSNAAYYLADSISESPSGLNDERRSYYKKLARDSAQRALRLSPELAEGHAALAWILLDWDWNVKAAEREFVLAVQLAPNSSRAKSGLGTMYAILGDLPRAAHVLEEARALDPLSSRSAVNLANVRLAQGDYEAAARLSRRALELEPEAPFAHWNLAMIALVRGDTSLALEEARQETDPDTKDYLLTLVQQALGNRTAAEEALRQFIVRHETESPFLVASLYAFRGDADSTFAWLNRAFAARDIGTIDFLYAPYFSQFRADPRFAAFCKTLGVDGETAQNL